MKRSRRALSDEALPRALRATTQAQTLERPTSSSCRGFFYGAHKADTGLPEAWRIHLTDANVFRKVRSNGHGACALPASFGNFFLNGELAAPSTCRKAAGALLLQLSRYYAARATALGERLAPVASML